MAEPEEVSLLHEVQRLVDADPFGPFVIIMGSGGRYEISATDTVVIGRNAISIFPQSKGWYLLRPSQISEVAVPGGPPWSTS